MHLEIDTILAKELGKMPWKVVADRTGIDLSQAFGGGGARGAAFAARFLPTEQRSILMEVTADPPTLLETVIRILDQFGRVVDSSEVGDSAYPIVAGCIGSGFLNMNPALVIVELVGLDSGVVTVRLTGAAKEGLIKQHTAEKAVARVSNELITRCGPSSLVV